MADNVKLTAEVGSRTSKGTLITQAIQDAANADYENIKVIQDNTAKFIQEMDIAISRALEAIGIECETRAKKLCPVDTGRLRNSITHTIDSDNEYAVIGTNVEYGPYVELGTSKQKAQPFLVPAAERNKKVYSQILEMYLKSS